MHESTASVNPVQLVLGEEEYLVERAIKAVLESARSADAGAELARVAASEVTVSRLSELVSPSLFTETRVVVLESAQDVSAEAADTLATYAREPVPGIVAVIAHSGGGRSKAAKSLPAELRQAGAAVTECPKITKPAERESFVRNEVRNAGGRIDAAAVTALIESIGTDLRELASAASQLVADAGGSIDEHAVGRYHTGRADVTGFVVAEKAVAGDRAAALVSLRWALHLGIAHVLIADALADAVRTIARVASAGTGNPNNLASQLSLPPWKVRKAQGQARGWTREGLIEAMGIVAELNAEVKGAAADANYALERAILRIVTLRSQ